MVVGTLGPRRFLASRIFTNGWLPATSVMLLKANTKSAFSSNAPLSRAASRLTGSPSVRLPARLAWTIQNIATWSSRASCFRPIAVAVARS